MTARLAWLAGALWSGVPGTDRRLVSALLDRVEVDWVEPPRSVLRRDDTAHDVPRGLHVHTVPAPPGASRPGLRALTAAAAASVVRRVTAGRPVVSGSPLLLLPARGTGRVLYVTDDWIAGAELMGLDATAVRATLRENLRRADAVAAVTPALLETLQIEAGGLAVPTLVLPNGAPPSHDAGVAVEPVAGLVGQLNERLDLAAVEAVVDAGVRLRVIGPRADRDPAVGRRLDALLTRDGVEYLGRVDPARLPAEVGRLAVGLTPYTPTAFNTASFPLKTLDYLAAGVPVVSTELPASRWLDTPHVRVAPDPGAFAAAVADRVAAVAGADASAEQADARARRELAEAHGWPNRAEALLRLIDGLGADQRSAGSATSVR